MAENSDISWTDNTFNPWMGCTKVSQACKFCYAETLMDSRYGKVRWGPSGTRVVTSDSNWKKPIKWNREAGEAGVRKRVFCASLADVFEDWHGVMHNHKGKQLPETMHDIRIRLFQLIDATPNLDWLLLTKRPENILPMLNRVYPVHTRADYDWPQQYRSNVWLGTTVEDQECAEYRVPKLLECRDLAQVLFLSCEPLLGSVDLTRIHDGNYELNALVGELKGTITRDIKFSHKVDWVIAGGESGAEPRPTDHAWFRSLRDQCLQSGVAFHFKQLSQCDGSHYGDFDKFPSDLQIRQLPTV